MKSSLAVVVERLSQSGLSYSECRDAVFGIGCFYRYKETCLFVLSHCVFSSCNIFVTFQYSVMQSVKKGSRNLASFSRQRPYIQGPVMYTVQYKHRVYLRKI